MKESTLQELSRRHEACLTTMISDGNGDAQLGAHPARFARACSSRHPPNECHCESGSSPSQSLSLLSCQSIRIPTRGCITVAILEGLEAQAIDTQCALRASSQDSTQHTICDAPRSPHKSHTDDRHAKFAARTTAARHKDCSKLNAKSETSSSKPPIIRAVFAAPMLSIDGSMASDY